MKKKSKKLNLNRETLYRMGVLAQAAGGILPQTTNCTLTPCYHTQVCTGGTDVNCSGAFSCGAATGCGPTAYVPCNSVTDPGGC
jgi:hypothetical protein